MRIYNIIYRYKLYHLLDSLRIKTKLNKEEAEKQCMKILDYSELIKNTKLYSYCYKNKLLPSLTKHMIRHKRQPWTEAEIRTEANKYKNISEFKLLANGAYAKSIKLNILRELFPYKRKPRI